MLSHFKEISKSGCRVTEAKIQSEEQKKQKTKKNQFLKYGTYYHVSHSFYSLVIEISARTGQTRDRAVILPYLFIYCQKARFWG